MFENNILIKGKHATYIKFLCEKTKLLGEGNAKNGAGVFKRYVDVLMVAPLIGVYNNLRASEDKSSEDKANILAEQIIKEKRQLEFGYNLVMLVDNSQNLNADQKIDLIFRENGNFDLYMDYLRGGIEYLYNYFSNGASTRADYYEKIINLVNEVQLAAEDNYDEILKKITE